MFLENSFGAPDPSKIAKDYSPDTPAIIKMMTEIYPYLTERSIKNRFTRIIKKLKGNNFIQESSDMDDLDTSQDSS